jgi:4-amino-4-deoxy-L-arabinose transferase-like glycosyltransferase
MRATGRNRPWRWVALLLALSAITVVRTVRLDADPPWTKRAGDVADEGYWTHNARMKVLTGTFAPDPFAQGLTMAPLHTIATYLVFKRFGVSLASARLLSAWAGVTILCMGALAVLWLTGEPAWAAAFVALLGLNDLFFAFTRIAFVEPMLNLLIFLSFIGLVAGMERRRLAWFALSGACFGLAALTKLTAAYTFLPFLIAFSMEAVRDRRFDLRPVLVWAAGVLVPFAIGEAVLWTRFGQAMRDFSSAYAPFLFGHSGWYTKLTLLVFNPLRIFTNEFINTWSVTLLILLAGCRLLPAVRVALPLHRIERCCLYWIAGTVATCAFAPSQLDRRYWGLLIPLSILSGRLAAWLMTARGVPALPVAERPARWAERLADIGLWYFGMYAVATIFWSGARWYLDLRGIPFRFGGVQTAALSVSAVVAWAAVRRRPAARWWPYLLVGSLLAFAVDWNLALFWSERFSRQGIVVVSLLPLALWATRLLIAGLRSNFRQVVLTVFGFYAVWTATTIASSLVSGSMLLRTASREIDQAIHASIGAEGPYDFFGNFPHQLALEGEGFPLYYWPYPGFEEINRRFIEYVERRPPRYYVHALPPQPVEALQVPPRLPEGLTGQILGTYCLQEFRGFCRRPLALVKLDRFDTMLLARYAEDGKMPSAAP